MGKLQGVQKLKDKRLCNGEDLAWSPSLLQCKELVREKLCTWVEAILEGATDSLSRRRSRCWCACRPTSMRTYEHAIT